MILNLIPATAQSRTEKRDDFMHSSNQAALSSGISSQAAQGPSGALLVPVPQVDRSNRALARAFSAAPIWRSNRGNLDEPSPGKSTNAVFNCGATSETSGLPKMAQNETQLLGSSQDRLGPMRWLRSPPRGRCFGGRATPILRGAFLQGGGQRELPERSMREMDSPPV
jgi:hypothetical protein